MSWRVHGEGRYYHDWNEYQTALRAYEENSATRQLQRRVTELQGQLQGLRGQSQAVSGQLRQEENLQRQFASTVQELERTSQRMQRAHAEEMERLDGELKYLKNTLDATQHSVDEIVTKFEEYQKDFNQRHEALQASIAADLANLHAEKRQTDNRLEELRRNAAAQFEQQRTARLEAEQDQIRRSHVALDLAAQTLKTASALADSIKHEQFRRSAAHISSQIESARQLAQNGHSTAALLAASTAQTEALTLEEQVHDARHRLETGQQRAAQILQRVRQLTEDPRVAKYYPVESAILARELEEATRNVPAIFADYTRYLAEGSRCLEKLEKIELSAENLNAKGPVGELQYNERKKRVQEAITKIEAELGQPVERTITPLDRNNPLSPVEFIINFNNEKLRLTFHCDREMEVCAYQHAHDYDCKKSMTAALRLVRSIMKVKDEDVEQNHDTLGQAPPPQVKLAEPARTAEQVSQQPRTS